MKGDNMDIIPRKPYDPQAPGECKHCQCGKHTGICGECGCLGSCATCRNKADYCVGMCWDCGSSDTF